MTIEFGSATVRRQNDDMGAVKEPIRSSRVSEGKEFQAMPYRTNEELP